MQDKNCNDRLTLDYLFHPRSIAVAGVSGDEAKFSAGRRFVRSLLDYGFKGKIYPIGSGDGEVFDLKIYPSIKDIPGSVDYVISAIPVRSTPQLVADCATKGVRAIQFFTSGFSEIEDKAGEQLELEILRIARQGGIRIIGPNCMGLYCPVTGLSFSLDFPGQKGFPKRSGSLGLIAQSGGNSFYSVREAATRGVYFSKVISYGNACDLNEADFLEYLADDPETKIIAAYIEGLRNSPRFTTVLRRATKAKPVIVFKAGTTEIGTRIAASHTSAIAGSNVIWESFLKQAGAIQVYSIEEVVDVALLFSCGFNPKGRNTAVIGAGGGVSVQSADNCSNAGLTLPMLPTQVKRKLNDIYVTEAGRIFRNPVDIAPFTGSEVLLNAIKVIADCERIDLLIMHVAFDAWSLIDRNDVVKPYIEAMLNLTTVVNKPVAIALHSHATDEAKQLASEAQVKLSEVGFPVYPSVKRAATAISRFMQYREWLEGNNNDDG